MLSRVIAKNVGYVFLRHIVVLLHYLRKYCSSSEIASCHSNAVSLLCQF